MKFGDWVEVSAILRRKKGGANYPNTWERQVCVPFKAIFLGTRTLWDSEYKCEESYGMDGPDIDTYIDNTNPTKGAVVCQKNRKPVYVRVEDCRLIGNPEVVVILEKIADILRQV